MQKTKHVRNLALVSGAGLAAASGIASADIGASITSAITEASGNVAAAAGGVVVVAAIMLGVGMIVGLFRK